MVLRRDENRARSLLFLLDEIVQSRRVGGDATVAQYDMQGLVGDLV